MGEDGGSKRGQDLGGVRTTPVRSLEAGAFRMEVWVEEGRGKFQAKVEDRGGWRGRSRVESEEGESRYVATRLPERVIASGKTPESILNHQ